MKKVNCPPETKGSPVALYLTWLGIVFPEYIYGVSCPPHFLSLLHKEVMLYAECHCSLTCGSSSAMFTGTSQVIRFVTLAVCLLNLARRWHNRRHILLLFFFFFNSFWFCIYWFLTLILFFYISNISPTLFFLFWIHIYYNLFIIFFW